MSVECSTNSIFSSCRVISPPVLSCSDRQLRHPQQIIRGSYPPRRQLRSRSSPKTRFPETSHRLHPTKDLFDSLSYPLAYTVARMPRGTAIDGRSPSSLDVGRHMRENLSPAQKTDKVLGVIALIGSQTFYPQSFSPLTIEQALGRFPLSAARSLTDFQIDQQPVAVLHQGMRSITQRGLLARPLAHQPTVGVGGGLMGVVATFLAMKIYPAVA